MKIKLALVVPVLIMLGTAGCVTSTNSYTRDIVYRDGSYYSPADEQNGDYYYEPEPDYSYYDDNYYYGFNSGNYGNSWYGNHYSSGCRLAYRYDRYCDNGWGNSFLNFGGLTIIFGNSNHFGYGHGYGYPHHGYYGGFPYYGWNAPRPRPYNNEPIPMPKQRRPNNPIPDYGYDNGPGMRVPGEPIRVPTKPGMVDQNPVEPRIEPQEQENLNPYTRTREPRQNVRPEIWRNNRDNNADEGIVIRNRRPVRPIADENYDPRLRTKPALLIEDNVYQPVEKPIRQNRRPQPYPTSTDMANDGQQTRVVVSSDTPPERARPDYRQERPAPRERVERVERAERVERPKRIERPIRTERQENNDPANDGR